MNYNLRKTLQKCDKLKSNKVRVSHKVGIIFYRLLLILAVAVIYLGISSGYGAITGLLDTAPSIDSIDVVPSGYATTIYDNDGKAIQTLVGKDANRIYVKLDKIPSNLQNAFIAIEDERFWQHNGIDVQGIVRAAARGLGSGDFSQGASTLTQQLLKNQVFNGGQETSLLEKFQRKIQEQYLALQLEKHLSKKEILEYYLNTINLGQNTLGVQAASKRYFGKSCSKLTLSECAVLAGITQNPAAYNPITHPDSNKRKRATILAYMKDQNYISSKDYEEALKDDVYKRISLVNEKITMKDQVTSYFEDSLLDQVMKDLKTKLGYTATQAYNAVYRGGLKIYSTQDSSLQKTCDSVINNPDYYPSDSTLQLSYQLSIRHKDGTESHYNESHVEEYFHKKNQSFSIYVKKKNSLKSKLSKFKKAKTKKGDTVSGEVTNYVLQPQVSFVLMDQSSGQVKALCGGRGDKNGSRTLNRASSTLRQPGSTFKILSTYLPALDTAGMTLASVQDDAPYNYPGTRRAVRNWYSSGFRGLTTLRQGITQSMNIVTVKTLDEVTPKIGYDYLIKLGFTSLVENSTNSKGQTFTDIALPMALGGLTRGVSNLELTAGFAAIANRGTYEEPIFYTKIMDHNGNVLLERKPVTRRVMKESTAWLLTSAMQDVVNRGTGTRAHLQTTSMPVAGKTGTTTKEVDLWFVGYTPYYTAGVWGGYDKNLPQTNTSFHKNIWRTIMDKVSKGQKVKSFSRPSNIVSASICTKCGKLAVHGLCDKAEGGSCIKTEYFEAGTVPTEKCDCHIKCKFCKTSGELAGDNCPLADIIVKILLKKEKETGRTDDTPYVIPKKEKVCKHTGEQVAKETKKNK